MSGPATGPARSRRVAGTMPPRTEMEGTGLRERAPAFIQTRCAAPGRDFLLGRSEIALLGSNVHAFFARLDGNGSEGAVPGLVGGDVSEAVLAAQLARDLLKICGEVGCFKGEEGPATGLLGQVLQHFVAPRRDAAAIGADPVNSDFPALGHGQGLIARVLALVIEAVADDDQYSSQIRLRRGKDQHLRFAREVYRIAESRPPAGLYAGAGA